MNGFSRKCPFRDAQLPMRIFFLCKENPAYGQTRLLMTVFQSNRMLTGLQPEAFPQIFQNLQYRIMLPEEVTELHQQLAIGDKIEIIPNHICPVCNLYDKAYLVSGGEVVEKLEIAARGKLI